MSAPKTNKSLARREELLASVDSSSDKNRNFLIAFLGAILYLMVAIGSTTDKDLLMPASQFELPIVGVQVGLIPFYLIAPLLLLLFHLSLLYNLLAHRRRLSELAKAEKETEQSSRYSIHAFLFNSYGREDNQGVDAWVARILTTISVVLAPFFLLIAFEIRFADYQSLPITFWHLFCVLLDIFIIWLFWERISNPVLLDEKYTKIPALLRATWRYGHVLGWFNLRVFCAWLVLVLTCVGSLSLGNAIDVDFFSVGFFEEKEKPTIGSIGENIGEPVLSDKGYIPDELTTQFNRHLKYLVGTESWSSELQWLFLLCGLCLSYLSLMQPKGGSFLKAQLSILAILGVLDVLLVLFGRDADDALLFGILPWLLPSILVAVIFIRQRRRLVEIQAKLDEKPESVLSLIMFGGVGLSLLQGAISISVVFSDPQERSLLTNYSESSLPNYQRNTQLDLLLGLLSDPFAIGSLCDSFELLCPRVVVRDEILFGALDSSKADLISNLEVAHSEENNKWNGGYLKTGDFPERLIPVDLSYSSLRLADFSRSKMYGVKLIGVRAEGSFWKSCSLNFADFSGANMNGALFLNSRMPQVSLNFSDVRFANFHNSIFSDMNFNSTNIDGAKFGKVTFSDVSFSSMKINGAFFNSASFSRAKFYLNKLKYVDFTGAKFSGGSIKSSLLEGVNFKYANLDSVELKETVLSHSFFEGVDFSQMDLSDTELASIDIKDVSMSRVIFSNKNISQMNLLGVDTTFWEYWSPSADNEQFKSDKSWLKNKELLPSPFKLEEYLGRCIREVCTSKLKGVEPPNFTEINKTFCYGLAKSKPLTLSEKKISRNFTQSWANKSFCDAFVQKSEM